MNALTPGPINTPAYDRLVKSGPAGQQMLASVVNRVPMGRFGTPDEIARAAFFLASDDSTFVTGTKLFVDGGAAPKFNHHRLVQRSISCGSCN